MIYAYQFLATILLVLVFSADALRITTRMALSDYRAELAATAAKIAGPGKI